MFALAAVAIAWRERDRLILGLGAAALAWWVLVVAMTLDGYPGLERFFLPAAAIISVLGGVGLVRVAGVAGGALNRRLSRRRRVGIAAGDRARRDLDSVHDQPDQHGPRGEADRRPGGHAAQPTQLLPSPPSAATTGSFPASRALPR